MRRGARGTVALGALAALAAACATPTRVAPPAVVEFESAARGGERTEGWAAAGGAALRLSVATPPVVVARPPSAEATVATGATSGDVLWIRYATSAAAPLRRIVVRHGTTSTPFELAATGQRDRFEWRPLSLRGALPAGGGDVELVLPDASGGDLWLDQFAWGSSPLAPPDPAASPPVWRDGALELRAAPGARVFDPPWVQHLLREQYAAVAHLLDRELSGPLLLVALPAARWPRPGAGAFQSGRAIYLRDDELHLPWRSFAHEIAHVFEEERPSALPRFWSEGLACALADEVEARLYDRGVARARVRWRELLAKGDAGFRPGDAPPNPALAFARSPADGVTNDRSDYEWAGAVVDALAQAGGPGYFARLQALLEIPPPRGSRDDSPADAAAPFVAAARADVSVLLLRAGIPFPPGDPGTFPDAAAAADSGR